MWKFKSLQKPLVLLFLFCLLPLGALAQSIVKGTVNDEAGEPVIGASVKVVGTNTGAVTDLNGKFSVSAPQTGRLEISYVGYITQKVSIGGRQNITITLKEDAQTLSDVVVIGYGTMKKSDISGSVATVDQEAVMRKAPVNVAQALQGAAAGVMVTQQDGAPDANAQIRIRGVGTINGNAAPLYVVDGVKVGYDANFLNPADIESIEILKDASATAIYGSEGANGVVMITTKHGQKGQMQIQFTADFGFQTLPYKLNTLGVDKVAATIREARKNDGNQLYNQVWAAEYDGKRNEIDWQDQMTQTGIKQQYGISANGGTEKTLYNFSVGYLDNKGLIVNTKYNRLTARAGVKSQINFLQFGGDINYVHSETSGSNAGLGNNINLSSHRDLAYMTPTLDYIDPNTGQLVNVNVVNPDGTYGSGYWATSTGWEGNTAMLQNVYATQKELSRIDRSDRVSASAFIDIEFMKGLNLHSIGSFTHTSTDNDDFTGGYERYNFTNGARGNNVYFGDNKYNFSLGQTMGNSMGIETYLTYKWETDFNTLTLMAGNSVSKYYGRWVGASAYDFMSSKNRRTDLGLDDSLKKGSGGFNADSRMISYYGRLIYNLFDRYVLTATVRRDGSSNFSSGHRWGTFPSAALAWRISEEPFMKDVTAISNLKLRLGWGQTGNAGNMAGKAVYALSSSGVRYNFYQNGGLGSISEATMDKATGFYAPLVDTNLKWETNEQYNIGVDFGLLGGDLNVTIDYFIRNTKDLLLQLPIRQSSGYSQIYTNYGTIQNKGLEFALNYNKRLSKDLSINVGVTGSTIKNEVTKMPDLPITAQATGGNSTYTAKNGADDITGDGSNSFAVDGGSNWDNHSYTTKGYVVGSYYGWKTNGIFKDQADIDNYTNEKGNHITQDKAQPGDFKFVDINNDGVINDDDRTVIGNGLPKFNFGLTLGAKYKNWDFNVYTYGQLGLKVLSYSAMRLSTLYYNDDNTTPALLEDSYKEIWSQDNPNGTLPRLSMSDNNKNMRVSDAWVKKGDFLKISNVQVGYTFNKDMLKSLPIQQARVYVAIQNLATISPYTKYGDPECGQGSVLFTGLDTGRYPIPRTFMGGLNITF